MGDFIKNKVDAEVDLDANKHELLEIPVLKNDKERGINYHVLLVGIGKQGIPTVTIENSKREIFVYRLPFELQEWAQTSVNITMKIPNLFPANVEFGEKPSTIYAHFI